MKRSALSVRPLAIAAMVVGVLALTGCNNGGGGSQPDGTSGAGAATGSFSGTLEAGEPAGVGTIIGAVGTQPNPSDSASQIPLPNIRVSFIDVESGETVATALTDAQGAFAQTLPAGKTFRTYLLYFDDPAGGYSPDFLRDAGDGGEPGVPPPTPSVQNANPLTLHPGEIIPTGDSQASQYSLMLVKVGGDVRGNVVSVHDNAPLEGLRVRFVDVATAEVIAEVLTDASGYFEKTVLAGRTFLLYFEDPDRAFIDGYLVSGAGEGGPPGPGDDGSRIQPNILIAERLEAHPNFVLDLTSTEGSGITMQSAQGMVSGTVANEAGTPLAGILVAILNPRTGDTVASGLSGSAGDFLIVLPVGDRYIARFSDPSGVYADTLLADLNSGGGGGGEPPPLPDLANATRFPVFSAQNTVLDGSDTSEGAPIVLALRTSPGGVSGRISGRVVLLRHDPASPSPSIEPGPDMTVRVYDWHTGATAATTTSVLTGPLEDGEAVFEASVPVPGNYVVRVSDDLGNFQTRFYGIPNGSEAEVDNADVVILDSLQTDRDIGDIELEESFGYLTGIVRGEDYEEAADEGGDPGGGILRGAGNLLVTVFDAVRGLPLAGARTLANGSFERTLPVPGSYLLRFSDPDLEGPYAPEFFDDRFDIQTADIIQLAASGAQKHYDASSQNVLTLPPGRVSGSVRAESGVPDEFVSGEGVRVSFIDDTTGRIVARTRVKPNEDPEDDTYGLYSQRLPVPGLYLVRFDDPNGIGPYRLEFFDGPRDLTAADLVSIEESLPQREIQRLTLELDRAPSLTLPPDISQEATSALTPVDIGEAVAVDAEDRDPPDVENNAPEHGFPVGDTEVVWTATDLAGNQTSGVQVITITDSTPPVVTAPADVTAEATGPLTQVDIGTATATDNASLLPIVNDAPAEGFPLHTTVVTWTATDDAGNAATATQNVTVEDTTAPNLENVPADVTLTAESAAGVVFDFALPGAHDLVDPAPQVACDPGSGSTFAIGETAVTCIATDSEGNQREAGFTVTVVSEDADGDGVPDHLDQCPAENATGFDSDGDGCVDSVDGLQQIIDDLVASGEVAGQMENSLKSKLDGIETKVAQQQLCAAINRLGAFINQVEAQRGKKISEAAAVELLAYADSLAASLNSLLPPGEACP